MLLGVIRVSPECNWPTMDQKIYAILEVCFLERSHKYSKPCSCLTEL